MFGLKLDIKWSKIKEIARNRYHKHPHLCMADLLDFWLGHDLEASWERVTTALEDMNMTRLAVEVREAYCS